MNKKITNIFSIVMLFLLIYLAFKNYLMIQKSVIDNSIIFIKNVFPFLFIMLIINNLLIECNFPYYFNKVFHNKYIYIFVMSMLSGAPTNAIIIESFLDKKIITPKDASYLISFTTFNSPLFLYNYFQLIFHDKRITIMMFVIIYLENLIPFMLFNNKLSDKQYSIDKTNHTFFNSLSESISRAIKSIINIYATIMVFQILCDLTLTKDTILRGFIEITQGLNIISRSTYSLKTKELLSLVILSFSGLSIHIQISNILQKYPINYRYFYLIKVFTINVPICFYLYTKHYHLDQHMPFQ